MSSGLRHLIRQAALWLTGALLIVGIVYFYEDYAELIRSGREAAVEIASNTVTSKPEAPRPNLSGGMVRIPAGPGGHYAVEARINGQPLDMMVDTGASLVVLTYEDARRAGLHPSEADFTGRAQTANGVARVAPATLDRIAIGNINLYGVKAAIAERGALGVNLLGMSFLSELRHFEIRNRELVLSQ